MFDKISLSWNCSQPLRFLIVGAWNFIFGYVAFAGIYWCLKGCWTDWAITLTANILGISMSFITHRFFTYKSNGCWWKEYLLFYAVYSGQAVFNILLIWMLVTKAGLNAYIIQFSVSIILTISSYWFHKNFSFKRRP
jgi:putative flippase GtrA